MHGVGVIVYLLDLGNGRPTCRGWVLSPYLFSRLET